MLRWLWDTTDLGYVSPWSPLIAERHAEATARMLLGDCGPAVVVGSRRDEAVLADREQRLAEMDRRQAAVVRPFRRQR